MISQGNLEHYTFIGVGCIFPYYICTFLWLQNNVFIYKEVIREASKLLDGYTDHQEVLCMPILIYCDIKGAYFE